jgi:hypothetical protein
VVLSAMKAMQINTWLIVSLPNWPRMWSSSSSSASASASSSASTRICLFVLAFFVFGAMSYGFSFTGPLGLPSPRGPSFPFHFFA